MTNYDEVLGIYLKEINKIPLLNHDEETELAVKAKNGDKAARDKIVNANLRFVINVAKNYQNRGLDLCDLISEGNIGLLTAIEKFDVTKGYHFISYAVWWIRQTILKAVCEKGRAIRLPMNRVNELVQIEKARKIVHGKGTEAEEIEEIAAMLGMERQHVSEMLEINREMISLDAQIENKNGDSGTVGDFVKDEKYSDVDEKVIAESLQKDLDSVLGTLKPAEEKVLRMRYGLDGSKPMSLAQVGEKCNLTKERIRQIEKTAIGRMQHPVRARRLECYVA
ncbi:RNA polymerase sigma factor RpoD/SigA [Treponema berlinense]|uniref:sigma-70 family RNA polymerase sigma factor n=1 Tax=Treponema berlinense TaxID=225004 RepID=UPI0015BDC2F5|nr:RNA polymerase sigma factor RpoD/SigA [Treponema berlinense]